MPYPIMTTAEYRIMKKAAEGGTVTFIRETKNYVILKFSLAGETFETTCRIPKNTNFHRVLIPLIGKSA